MPKHPRAGELVEGWLRPGQTAPGVRHDLARCARNARRSQMLEVCYRLRSFARPVLVIWAPEDRVQRPDHGRRPAALLPNARLAEIPDSYTLIMRDHPAAFATPAPEFVRGTTAREP